MALPVQTDIVKMDYLFFGMPFVSVPSKDAVDTTGMDYLFFGMPFVTNDGFTAAPPAVTSVLGIIFID